MLLSRLAISGLPIIVAFAYWVYWRWSHRRVLQLAALMPGPPALPVLGNALVFIANPDVLLGTIANLVAEYGQYVRVWMGPELNVYVKNPDDIRLLLTSNKINQKGPLYKFLEPYIGPGMLSGGPTWRNHRKIVTPSYSKKANVHYAEIFNTEAEYLAETLCKKDPNVTFNVYLDVVKSTTQSVCQTLMGLSKEESKTIKRLDELVKLTQTMYGFMFTKLTRWWLQIPPVFWLVGGAKKENYYINLIKDFASDVVSKRQKALSQNHLTNEDALGIVDRYILSGELTEQEIVFETFTLFTTSQEASAKIASAVLLILAHYPEWQEKVYNEILEVLGPDDTFVTEEQTKKLKNLDLVYKETLRYMSIAAFIQRCVEDEISINNGAITLPAGASVIIPIHLVHRDPQYWEDPNKIKPERFLPENSKERNPNAFVPFSLGPMDCLGRVYATSLIKTLVVRILRRVQFEADGAIEDLDLNVAISVRFSKGYNLRAKPRSLNIK